MQRFQDIQIADIVDEDDEPQQLVAVFKGKIDIKDKFWRNRYVEFSLILTLDEFPVKMTSTLEAEQLGEKVHLSSDELLKGQAHLETKLAFLDEDLVDGTDLLLWPRPHRKYRLPSITGPA